MQQDYPTGAPIALSSIPAPRQRRRKGTVSAQAKGNAAIYLRVSTDEQAEDGNSLESQQARCRALCEARGLTVVDTYLDAGYSGGTVGRPDLSALREAVKAGTIGVVVVYAVDRLSRSQRDTLNLLDEFEQAGAGLASASQPFDTTTPMGKAMIAMLAVFAELQRAEIRDRTRVALKRKAGRGEAVNRLPLGVKRNGKGYECDPETWPIVARILAERASGATCARIADNLNAQGVPRARTAAAAIEPIRRAGSRGSESGMTLPPGACSSSEAGESSAPAETPACQWSSGGSARVAWRPLLVCSAVVRETGRLELSRAWALGFGSVKPSVAAEQVEAVGGGRARWLGH